MFLTSKFEIVHLSLKIIAFLIFEDHMIPPQLKNKNRPRIGVITLEYLNVEI